MSWKLTIDVIFNSFPLIKTKIWSFFSVIASEAWKSSDLKPSLRTKWSNPATSTLSLRTKWSNPMTSNSSLRTKWSNPTTSIPSLWTKWSNPATLTPSLRAKWSNPVTFNPSLRAKQWFQRGCGEKIPRIKGFKGSMDFLMQGLMMLWGKWTFQCKHSKFLGVYGQKNARTQRNWG